ncbi:MAG: hypothetical protein ACLR06_02365 [Christensenellaceae bacterium]
MKNKFHKKRIVGLAAAMLCCSMILFGCGVGNNNTPKRQYDPFTRVPTDNGEQVFTIDQDYARYNNYIELYDGDGDIYDIGDPYVFRFNGKYYLYTSLNGNKNIRAKFLAGNRTIWSTGNGAAGHTTPTVPRSRPKHT